MHLLPVHKISVRALGLKLIHTHTSYLSQTPQTCLCKNFLSGVNFSRLSEKNAYIWLFRDIFSVFGAFSCFFGCKICPVCVKEMTNMRYVIVMMLLLMVRICKMIMIIDTISKNLVGAAVLRCKIKCFSSQRILAMCNMKYSVMTFVQPLTYLVTRNPARLTQAFASR